MTSQPPPTKTVEEAREAIIVAKRAGYGPYVIGLRLDDFEAAIRRAAEAEVVKLREALADIAREADESIPTARSRPRILTIRDVARRALASPEETGGTDA